MVKSTMQRAMTVCATLGLIALLSVPSHAEIIVFGDSLSDRGNTYDYTWGSVPDQRYYDSGRFSNGPTWVEHLALYLGENMPIPSRKGGWNFAHGGSQVSASDLFQPSLWEQVTQFGSANASDLHVIWAGANDLLAVDLTLPVADQQLLAAQYARGVRANVRRLHDMGARRFLLLNLPPLGVTPLASATLISQDRSELNDLSVVFNTTLAHELKNLRSSFPTLDIIEFDVHAFFYLAIADPTVFGLPANFNVTQSATPFSTGGMIAGLASGYPTNPDNHLFYDGLHPTAVTHAILGREVALASGAGPLPVFDAPTNLSGFTSRTTVTLNWNDNSNVEEGFQIEYAVKSRRTTSWSTITSTGANTTSAVFTLPNGTYLFRVRAFKDGRTSFTNPSNEIQLTVDDGSGGGKGRPK